MAEVVEEIYGKEKNGYDADEILGGLDQDDLLEDIDGGLDHGQEMENILVEDAGIDIPEDNNIQVPEWAEDDVDDEGLELGDHQQLDDINVDIDQDAFMNVEENLLDHHEESESEYYQGIDEFLADVDPEEIQETMKDHEPLDPILGVQDEIIQPEELIIEPFAEEPGPGRYEDVVKNTRIPNFAREMGLRHLDVRQDLELLETLNANIDHLEVPPKAKKQRKEAAKKLYAEKRSFLKQVQSKYDASSFIIGSAPAIEAQMSLSPEAFVDIFDGGDSSRVMGEGFKSIGVVGGQYQRGIKKLESLSRKEGSFETEIDYERVVRDAIGDELFQELNLSNRIAETGQGDIESVILEEEIGKLIGETMKEDPEKGQELIDKRNNLKSEINEEKRNEALKYAMKESIKDPEIGERAYREIIESENPDLGFLRQDNVESMLESLAEEHLSEDCSAYHEAKRLADNMDGREVEFEVYDKSFENMPYKNGREYPCTLPGSSHAKSVYFAEYMLDPGMQIGKISTEKGSGVALMKIVEHGDEDFLYVHSVEADRGENIASDREMAREIQNQIENYAEEVSQQTYRIGAKEVDVEGIMYSMNGHDVGTAANFRRAVKDAENPNTVEQELAQVGFEYGQHQGVDYNLQDGVEVYQKPVDEL